MPELPEMEGLASWLNGHLSGRRLDSVRLRSVSALKTYDPPFSDLSGRTVHEVSRRGKYLEVGFGELYLVVHLSRGGWARWQDEVKSRKAAQRGPLIAELLFEHGTLDLTEHGKEKRLALWVARSPDDVPQVASLGCEALDPALGLERFSQLIREHAGTIKTVLADQHVIAGIGNAYSDEILHAARISPFTRTVALTDEQVEGLYSATKSVLMEAVSRAVGLPPAQLKDDKRSHFSVHARTGQPCPVCGDTVREVWHASSSFQYCPTCQAGGKVYADRRLSRLGVRR